MYFCKPSPEGLARVGRPRSNTLVYTERRPEVVTPFPGACGVSDCNASKPLNRVSCFVIGGAPAGTESAYPAEPGKEGPLITALRTGPDEIIKIWGEGVIPPLRERLLANDAAALIACAQRPREESSDVLGAIAVPTLIYAGSADPIHNAARQSASAIPGAQFVSFPGLSHPEALWRSDLVLRQVEPFLAKGTAR